MSKRILRSDLFSREYGIFDLNDKLKFDIEFGSGFKYLYNSFDSDISATSLVTLGNFGNTFTDLKIIGNKAYVLSSSYASIFEFDYINNKLSSTINFKSRATNGVFITEITPTAINFKSDGTKLYILGDQNNNIYQFSLSTAWDISTLSYDSKTFSVGTQEGTPAGMFFKDDGTKVYVVGSVNDTIYQYSLSTAWDISTASYDTKSFSVTSQQPTPSGLFFKSDGTKVYVGGSTNIHQYSLSTAWDISTASYDSKTYNSGTGVNDLFFKSDGTKVYIITSTKIEQYSLSTAWDISTASYDNKFLANLINTQQGIFFKSDGTKVFSIGTGNDRDICEISLSTAWEITSGLPYTGFYIGNQDVSPQALFFRDDGKKVYVLGSDSDNVRQYSLSTAWNITTASYDSKALYVGVQEGTPTGLFFKSDGTKVYVVGNGNSKIFQYTLTTAWDVSTGSYDSVSSSFSFGSLTSPKLFFDYNGTKLLLNSSNTITFYNLLTAWDISTIYTTLQPRQDVKSLSVGSQDGTPTGVFFRTDGTKVYILGDTNNTIYQYSLSTSWDVSTGSYDSKSFSVGSQDGTPTGLFFKPDGTKFYIIGDANNTIYQYSLSIAWDISTASYDTKSFSVGTQEATPTDLFFKPDGTKVYIIGTTNRKIFEYSLGTAWDISTATFSNFASISLTNFEFSPQGMYFKDDGTILYIIGSNSNSITEFVLKTPWNVSATSLLLNNRFSVSTLDSSCVSIYPKSDGKTFYVLGSTNDKIYQVGEFISEWNISTRPSYKIITISFPFSISGTNNFYSFSSNSDLSRLYGGFTRGVIVYDYID